ncbi:Predicted Zn-finger protein [Plasmopara halstedii]|uniref:Predicted Zn-finger protein n=1 Tax=Plasmopara halstedii TaxID=4781 RepID=A0A0P1B0H6_PLAHL|nr:Predicted Zn-finger protein [Plasmopara halstedii]CEG47264.1 Predicted Zn-finger protein [Plasmopara halstedii]|eukprot:XP_024583633.1 Predicted Zn-finger protein [Plasmopara halstedii]
MERVPIRLGSLRTSLKPSCNVSASNLCEEGTTLTSASLSRVCRVCTTQEARYTCPRCNTPYCSVNCYRSHGEDCTEKFFESHVRDEMKIISNRRSNDGRIQQKSIQELLERVRVFQNEQQQLVDDENEEEMLTSRMEELALLDKSGQLTFDSLTEEEKRKFLREVADGRLGKLVELWSPWWLMSERKYRSETSSRRRQLIFEEINEEDQVDKTAVEPLGLYPIGIFTHNDAQQLPKSICDLLPGGKHPSPLLRFHLVEMLSAYALVLRVYNGDYTQDIIEAAFMLMDLCCVLNEDTRYESLEHVCLACLEKQSSAGPAANMLALQDAQQILRTGVFLLDALSDMRALFQRYQQDLEFSVKVDRKVRKEVKIARKKLTAVMRKIRFYQTWANLTPIDEFQALAAEIAVYIEFHRTLDR